MRVTKVETIQCKAYSNLVWVRLETDEGLVGYGETFRNPEATAAYIHETCAPYLLGKDPLQTDRHAHALMNQVGNRFIGFPTRSVELRGNSAVDFALWDLAGKARDEPVHQLLGGLSRERIRIYNTCASPAYNSVARTGYNTELLRPGDAPREGAGRYDDLQAQLARPGELAQDLLDEGITGMKVWPFDSFALESNGHYIAPDDLRRGVACVEAIRKAVGDRMDVMMEYHSLWHLPAISQIADALRDLKVFWHEDPLAMDNFDDLAAFRQSIDTRVCGSESLGTRAWYREVFERRAVDVAHFDMCWVGGLTEGRRIAALADTYHRPIAPHDCVGPLTLIASVHLVMNVPNALIQETVRAFCRGYYQEIVTALPRIEDGYVYPMQGPGLGADLSPEFLARDDLTIRATAA